jgi:hypothetical protein
MITAILFSLSIGLRCQILKIALKLVLIVAPKLFIEPGTKASFFKLLSVSGPRIVNNFAASASPGYE